MRFLYKYPTRGRPEWFRQTLAAYYSHMSGQHDFRFIVTMDDNDASMNNTPMRQWLESQQRLRFHFGPHANKIQACNSGMDEDFDIVILVSDDMQPIVHGFDDIIAQDMQRQFPGLDGVLHYNDGRCGDACMTLQILGREFYKKVGFIYWPLYQGNWCDNETTDLAKQCGKYWYSDRTIIRHDWQRQCAGDVTYQRGQADFQTDNDAYQWRKSIKFPCKYSQTDEDWTIRRYFKDQYKGRFLDIGAADGVTFSNTRLLYEMGWGGVSVEPSDNFCRNFFVRRLTQPDREVRIFDPQRITLVQAALTDHDGPVEFYHTPDFTSTLNENHKDLWSGTTTYRKVGVDGVCWKTLIAKYGTDFDMLNLDIEGDSVVRFREIPAELLRRLRMVCVEYDGNPGAVNDICQPHGFWQIHQTGENVILAR